LESTPLRFTTSLIGDNEMENSEIAWTDSTFDPWIGCTKVSPGCQNCYAEHETFVRVQRAKGRELWGKGKLRYRTSEANGQLTCAYNNSLI
jgi:protein gp37